jgi:hypothetical protein
MISSSTQHESKQAKSCLCLLAKSCQVAWHVHHQKAGVKWTACAKKMAGYAAAAGFL